MPRIPKPSPDAAPQELRRPLRYLREEGLFQCAICKALVCHAPEGDVTAALGFEHICGEE